MTKNKNELNKNDDELTKWDLILAGAFVISLVLGLLVSGFVVLVMTKG